MESLGDAQVQFQSQYYLYCIIFLIFDVEAIFLVPFGGVHTPAAGAFYRHPVFPAAPARGLVWGLEQELLDWPECVRARDDEQRSMKGCERLQKRGVWVTSTQELLQLGRRNSIWPLPVRAGLLRDRDDRDGRVAL